MYVRFFIVFNFLTFGLYFFRSMVTWIIAPLASNKNNKSGTQRNIDITFKSYMTTNVQKSSTDLTRNAFETLYSL